jgi:hypothetical protein
MFNGLSYRYNGSSYTFLSRYNVTKSSDKRYSRELKIQDKKKYYNGS